MSVKFCKDCKHVKVHLYSSGMYSPDLDCLHPLVLATDTKALTSYEPRGPSCFKERLGSSHWLFGSNKCGKQGKLYEKQDITYGELNAGK